MGITEILRRIWLFSANKTKSSESFSEQPTQLIFELKSSLRLIIVTLIQYAKQFVSIWVPLKAHHEIIQIQILTNIRCLHLLMANSTESFPTIVSSVTNETNLTWSNTSLKGFSSINFGRFVNASSSSSDISCCSFVLKPKMSKMTPPLRAS